MGIGVAEGKLQMEEYDPEWKVRGQEMVSSLKSIMKKAVDIQHVGSTSIPGMFSKPLIDIAVEVNDLDDILEYVDELEKLEIHYVGEYIQGQREFYKDNPGTKERACHIHVVLKDSDQWQNYLNIRDYCTANKEAREDYIALKKDLLKKYADAPEKYGPAKAEFMLNLREKARKWRKMQSDWKNEEKYRKNSYVLTGYQAHFYKYWEKYPEIQLGNAPTLVKIPHGITTPEKLADAAYQVLKHHPAYSIVLEKKEGRVVQSLGKDIVSVPEIISLSEKEFLERKTQLTKKFNPMVSPLYQCQIYTTEKAEYLFLDIHHIITDKSAIDITVRDIFAVLNGQELKPDYLFSFLNDHQELRKNLGEIFLKDESYSRHPKFDMEEDNCEIGQIQTFMDISAAELKKKLEKWGTTPLKFFLAVTLQTMGEYNGNKKEIVNWLYGGRNTEEKQNMAGLLVSTIPVAVDLNEFDTMEKLLKEVQRINHENRKYSELSPGDYQADPVTEDTITVNYIPFNAELEEQCFPKGVKMESLMNENKYNTNVFYVIILGAEEDKPLQLLFKYHKSVYKKERIEQFIKLYIERLREYLS